MLNFFLLLFSTDVLKKYRGMRLPGVPDTNVEQVRFKRYDNSRQVLTMKWKLHRAIDMFQGQFPSAQIARKSAFIFHWQGRRYSDNDALIGVL